jgi:hypothetical protein
MRSGSLTRFVGSGDRRMFYKFVRWSLLGLALTGICVALLGLAALCFGVRGPSEQSLVDALKNVDRIRVRTGGTCHRNIDAEETLFEETDRAVIEDIVHAIRIDPSDLISHCMCCGNPSFEFYRDSKLIVTVGYHHGKSLRWREGWRGDGMLIQSSADFLNAWLASHGIDAKNGALPRPVNALSPPGPI